MISIHRFFFKLYKCGRTFERFTRLIIKPSLFFNKPIENIAFLFEFRYNRYNLFRFFVYENNKIGFNVIVSKEEDTLLFIIWPRYFRA